MLSLSVRVLQRHSDGCNYSITTSFEKHERTSCTYLYMACIPRRRVCDVDGVMDTEHVVKKSIKGPGNPRKRVENHIQYDQLLSMSSRSTCSTQRLAGGQIKISGKVGRIRKTNDTFFFSWGYPVHHEPGLLVKGATCLLVSHVVEDDSPSHKQQTRLVVSGVLEGRNSSS